MVDRRISKRQVGNAFNATPASSGPGEFRPRRVPAPASSGPGGDFHEQFAQSLVAIVSPRLSQAVLPVATGTAPVTMTAAQRVGSSARIVGIDMSFGLLRHADTHSAKLAAVATPSNCYLSTHVATLIRDFVTS